MTGMTAMGASCEREDPRGRDGVHEDDVLPIAAGKAAVTDHELIAPVPLGGPCLGKAFEPVRVSDPHGVALAHAVEPFLSRVAARRQHHMGELRGLTPFCRA